MTSEQLILALTQTEKQERGIRIMWIVSEQTPLSHPGSHLLQISIWTAVGAAGGDAQQDAAGDRHHTLHQAALISGSGSRRRYGTKVAVEDIVSLLYVHDQIMSHFSRFAAR